MVKNESDKDIIKKILTERELDIFTRSYELYKSLENGVYKNFLLRRMDDVLSIVRYINMSYPNFSQEDYDCLGSRILYLDIAMRHFTNPEQANSNIGYCLNYHGIPRIMSSISALDLERFKEVDDLLSSVSSEDNNEVTLSGNLKGIYGPTQLVIYLKDGSRVMVYDIVSYQRNTKLDSSTIKARCMSQLDDIDPNIHSIYDEMIYSALHFNFAHQNKGYGKVKEIGTAHEK
jgi:hypothetical protein